MVMRPGTYLAKRREAAGMSIEDVAVRISTEPPLHLRDRVDWLKRLEEDVATVTLRDIEALKPVFRFSRWVLSQLIDLQAGECLTAPRLCRHCACNRHDACIDAQGRGCSWAADDLCSGCAGVADETAQERAG